MSTHPGMPTDEQQDSAAEVFYGVDEAPAPPTNTAAKAAFRENFTALWKRIQDMAQEGDMEELLLACRDYFEADAAREDHPEVKACLTGAAEMCEHASFNFYASFK